MKVTNNPATFEPFQQASVIEMDTEIDVMFECPGILLSQGSQHLFSKIIQSLKPKPHRKVAFTNLDQIRCSIAEVSKYTPSDKAIWSANQD
jgi:hypothetical protein